MSACAGIAFALSSPAHGKNLLVAPAGRTAAAPPARDHTLPPRRAYVLPFPTAPPAVPS
jgi:hypothetical protein